MKQPIQTLHLRALRNRASRGDRQGTKTTKKDLSTRFGIAPRTHPEVKESPCRKSKKETLVMPEVRAHAFDASLIMTQKDKDSRVTLMRANPPSRDKKSESEIGTS